MWVEGQGYSYYKSKLPPSHGFGVMRKGIRSREIDLSIVVLEKVTDVFPGLC